MAMKQRGNIDLKSEILPSCFRSRRISMSAVKTEVNDKVKYSNYHTLCIQKQCYLLKTKISNLSKISNLCPYILLISAVCVVFDKSA